MFVIWYVRYLICSISDSVIVDNAKAELSVLLTPVKNSFTGDVNTCAELFSGVTDTGKALKTEKVSLTGVNDAGEKFLFGVNDAPVMYASPMSTMPVI
jgi:hypothetical protein